MTGSCVKTLFQMDEEKWEFLIHTLKMFFHYFLAESTTKFTLGKSPCIPERI